MASLADLLADSRPIKSLIVRLATYLDGDVATAAARGVTLRLSTKRFKASRQLNYVFYVT